MDRQSSYRVARLSVYPPAQAGNAAPYALIANTIVRGVPNAKVIAEGRLQGVDPFPTPEQMFEAMDAAIRQWRLL